MHKVRHVSEQAEPETIRDFVSYFAKGLELGDLPSARGTRYISSRIPLDSPDFNAKCQKAPNFNRMDDPFVDRV